MEHSTLMTPSQVAKELGIGRSTAYRLLTQGAIPTLRVPGTKILRVRRQDFERALTSGMIGVRSSPTMQ
jgi:excisionase family DNA binding protein